MVKYLYKYYHHWIIGLWFNLLCALCHLIRLWHLVWYAKDLLHCIACRLEKANTQRPGYVNAKRNIQMSMKFSQGILHVQASARHCFIFKPMKWSSTQPVLSSQHVLNFILVSYVMSSSFLMLRFVFVDFLCSNYRFIIHGIKLTFRTSHCR